MVIVNRVNSKRMMIKRKMEGCIMRKRKMVTCLTVLALVAVLAGIFYYISYVNNSSSEKRGTLVRAFTQKVDECCI
ncbi:hypothetical protein D7Y41_16610 [Anaerotruncus sp. 1XD22-93]|jgi:hypothetical protein|nr:hypothetical protein [Lachnospiraceae bacterium]NBI75707.1 hypothetical protein [Lachnospiraceae bacterium]RKJ90924.1 hypothetical protein D7Y41_16610 [Anaerotruncus sp. 1XD22-93]